MLKTLKLSNGKLTETQKKQYWKDGFLSPITFVNLEEAQKLRNELEKIETDYRDVKMARTLNTFKRMDAQCVIPLAYKIASTPKLLDVIEGVLGPDIMLYGAEFFIKEANTPHIVTMHQDLTYWGLGSTDKMVTAWMALSDVTVESGCMQFVAGSHKNKILPHQDTFSENNLLSRGQEIQVEVSDNDKTDIILNPGQFSLHHGRMIHGSGPNSSFDRRIGFVIRYLSPDVIQEVADVDYAILVRGADRKKNFINYSPPEELFSEKQIALYEEIRSAKKQAKMSGSSQKSYIYD